MSAATTPGGEASAGEGRAHELPLRTAAPAKINLGLFVGPTRADGKHELVSVMQPISLADELVLEPAANAGVPAAGVAVGDAPGAGGTGVADTSAGAGSADEVVCPGVTGENLAARAIALFRAATGWDAPPLRLRIAKGIPVAAGMGGGSADAGAALRLLHAASGLGDADLLLELAGRLGADVPAQVAPARALAGGAGERLCPLPEPRSPVGVLVLAQAHGLSTADVYAAADRLRSACPGSARSELSLAARGAQLRAALALGAPLPPPELLANDLQRACQSLSPNVERALGQAREVGADIALVSGSGPTVLGLFASADGPGRASQAATALAGRVPAPIAAGTVGADFAAIRRLRA